MTSKYESNYEDIKYLNNKTSVSDAKRECSIESIENGSKIGKNKCEADAEEIGKKIEMNCKFCIYKCKKRVTLMIHVNTKHGHDHSEPEQFSRNDK